MLELWTEFFQDLQNVRGRSQNTVKAYRHDLELYVEYKKSNQGIKGFYPYMKKKKLSDRSQARAISSLRTYFKFIEDRGVPAPELRELRLPKVQTKLPEVLSHEDYKKLFDACVVDDTNRTQRNKLTLMMLFGLGCRVSELIQLNIHDFNETQSWLTVMGKGNKQRVVPLTENLRTELKAYLETVRPDLIKDTTYSILINDRGNRPSRVDIWRWLSSWSKRAGFSEPIGPHQFRHGCATALLESGADLRSIQMLLGHSSLQTTQIYTTVTAKKLVETVEEHHPLSKLKDI